MTRQSTAEDTQPYVPPALVLKGHLRTWARHLSYEGQAVDLLTTHGTWLRNPQFVTDCVYYPDDDEAAVDWVAIPAFLDEHDASPFDTQVLLVAQQLAGLRTGSRPRRCLTPDELEPDILPLLSRAVGRRHASRLLDSMTAQ